MKYNIIKSVHCGSGGCFTIGTIVRFDLEINEALRQMVKIDNAYKKTGCICSCSVKETY